MVNTIPQVDIVDIEYRIFLLQSTAFKKEAKLHFEDHLRFKVRKSERMLYL